MPTVNMRVFEESKRHQVVQKYEVYPLNTTDIDNYQIELVGMASSIKEDARIIQNDLLDQWIESKGNVWSKLANLKAKTPQIVYGLSGNPSAISVSDGDETFEKFDDFEDGTLNKWAVTGSSIIQTSVVKSGIYAAKLVSPGAITMQSLSIDNCIIEYDWYYDYTSALFQPYLATYDVSSNPLWAHINEHDTRRIMYRTGAGYFNYSNGAHTDSGGSWRLWKLQYRDVSPYNAVWKDNVYLGTGALWNPQADIDDITFGSGSSFAGTTGYLDNFRIRKYIANEPIIQVTSMQNRASLIKALGSRL